jgi:hypothetical protein
MGESKRMKESLSRLKQMQGKATSQMVLVRKIPAMAQT